MPFIHPPVVPLGASFREHLNFMWKAEGSPIYVMDNHRGALWPWLCELRPNEPYVLIHVDSHWDDLPLGDQYVDLIRGAERGSLEEYLALAVNNGGRPYTLIGWDDYLRPVAILRPNLQQAVLLARAEVPSEHGALANLMADSPHPPRLMPEASYVSDWDAFLQKFTEATSLGHKTVINLDIDYFFLGDKAGRVRRECDNSQIEDMVKQLQSAAPDAIWTIALSPECCGSWTAAAEAFEPVAKVLSLSFPFDALDFGSALPIAASGKCWNDQAMGENSLENLG